MLSQVCLCAIYVVSQVCLCAMYVVSYIISCVLCGCRLLEKELQRVKKSSEHREKELRQQLTELKEDNDRQQKLIGQVSCCRSTVDGPLPLTNQSVFCETNDTCLQHLNYWPHDELMTQLKHLCPSSSFISSLMVQC